MARKKASTGPREKLIASGTDKNKFTVCVDSSEQLFHRFIKSEACNGSNTTNILWGDYTLEGLEDKFIVERKGAITELYTNLCTSDWDRFERELIALMDYPDSFLLFEFSFSDVLKFPSTCKLPLAVKRKLTSKRTYFLRRLMEMQTTYRIPIIWAGNKDNAHSIMISLFKRIWEKYANKA